MGGCSDRIDLMLGLYPRATRQNAIGEAILQLANFCRGGVGSASRNAAMLCTLTVIQTHHHLEMSADYFSDKPLDRELAIRRRVHRLAELYRHAVVFAIMMVPIWTANILLLYSLPSFAKNGFFVLGILLSVGWLIGLICHAVTVLPVWYFLTQEWEDRKVRELIESEQSGRSK